MLPDTGGPGEFRGGIGQEVVLRNDTGNPLVISGLSARTEFAPLGMHGGKPGSLRGYRLNDEVIHAKGRYTMQVGDELHTTEAGGGGFGDPCARDPEQLRSDVDNGYVSAAAAMRDYGFKA